MQRLIVVCQCGERIRVPRNAIGRTGLCPGCGRRLRVRSDNTVPFRPATYGFDRPARNTQRQAAHEAPLLPQVAYPRPAESDKLLFGKGVDLYISGKYGEALALFSSLLQRHPDNEDIYTARQLCAKGLRALPFEHRNLRPERLGEPQRLDAKFVHSFVLNMMMNGASENVQLQAAELACRILGMIEHHPGSPPPSSLSVLREAEPLANAG